MKFVRHGAPGAEKPGMIDADGRLRDLSDNVGDLVGEALAPDRLARLASLDTSALPIVESDTRIGAPVGNIGQLVCIGLNYSDHAAELDMPIPDEPVIFMKSPYSVMGPFDDLLLPSGSEKTDWEVELAIVIGTEALNVERADALRHIAGYAVINDVSERAWQLEGTGQWTKGKSYPGFAPLGPWLVTPDEVPDAHSLGIWTELSGTRMQDGNTKTMIFDVGYLVSFVSQRMALKPGDIIATGTPPGVGGGKKPPVFMKDGDDFRCGIEGLGEQRHAVKAS